jgi:GGDEF domain-containing protein
LKKNGVCLVLSSRIGGDEFAVLLPETDATSAQALAEGLQQLLHSKALPHPD